MPGGTIAYAGRLVESALASTDTLTLDGHGLETGDEVTVRAVEGGALAAPLAAGTVYYAIRATNSTFKLAASAGGAAVNLTANGTSMIVTREPPYDDTIEFYSRWADAFFPAHLVPFEAPIHAVVKGVVADLAAKRLMNMDGKSSATVDAAELAAKAMLERFARGLPLRGAADVARANKAYVSTLVGTTDPRGWGSEGLP